MKFPNRRVVHMKVDLKLLIPDWYRCPLCKEECYGLMSWASHTFQKHNLNYLSFEKTHGVWESYFGTNWKFRQPSDVIIPEKVQFT